MSDAPRRHPRVECRWAWPGAGPSVLLCERYWCPPQSHVGVCQSCPQRDNPDAPMKPPPEMDPEAHFGCKGCGG